MSRIGPGDYSRPPYEKVPPYAPPEKKLDSDLTSNDDGESIGEVESGSGGAMGDDRGRQQQGYQGKLRRPPNPPGVGENLDVEV